MLSQKRFSPLRGLITRLFVVLFTMTAILTPLAVEAKGASVPRKYAGIVIDAKSGKVLYESDADDYRYPASVTKVMTLYLLFQELEAGKVKLSDKMKVSKHAASAVPTKLGLKAGSSISVENVRSTVHCASGATPISSSARTSPPQCWQLVSPGSVG